MVLSSLILLAGSAAASIGMGVKKQRDATKQMQEAQDKIDSYERQTLTNTLAGVDTPYQMADLETRQVRQRAADASEAVAQAGARGLAMLPDIQETEFKQQEEVNARLEQNLYQLKLAQAQEEQRIQQMTEQREREELAGYGAMYEAGRQTKYSAMGDIIGGVQSIGGMLGQMESIGSNNALAKAVSNGYGGNFQGIQRADVTAPSIPNELPQNYNTLKRPSPIPNELPKDYFTLKV